MAGQPRPIARSAVAGEMGQAGGARQGQNHRNSKRGANRSSFVDPEKQTSKPEAPPRQAVEWKVNYGPRGPIRVNALVLICASISASFGKGVHEKVLVAVEMPSISTESSEAKILSRPLG